MSRIIVGGFLSALVVVFALQGVLAQRSVTVPKVTSAEAAAVNFVESPECDVASCCQDAEPGVLTEAPVPLRQGPLDVNQITIEFADTEAASEPEFASPIVQVRRTREDLFSAPEESPFAPEKKVLLANQSAPRSFDPNTFESNNDFGFPGETTPESSTTDKAEAPAMDRIWIMIHPDQGLQFLQTAEEVLLKKGQGAGTQQFFLIDCDKFSMEGKLGEEKPEFVLTCEDFALQGAYRTTKDLEIKGTKLTYDTASQVLTLSGTEEAPVQVSVRDEDESKLQAQEIILKLNDNSYQMQVSGANLELITVPAKLQPKPENRLNGPFGSL